MKKIVALGLVMIMLLAAGVGAFAYLKDAQSPPGDQMIAGTLDLKTNDADGVSRTLYALSMSPGDSAASEPVMLKNTGNVGGSTLDIVFSYAEDDGSPNTINKSADATAAVMQLTALTYDGADILPTLSLRHKCQWLSGFTGPGRRLQHGPPKKADRPGRGGFKKLCYFCPVMERDRK
jgi:hypothetical protein